MNNSSEKDLQCQKAIQILSPTYQAMLTAEISIASLALLPNILLLSAVRSVTIFPLNLRFLLGHVSFVLLLFCVGTIIRNSYVLNATPCSFEMSILGCRILDLMTTNCVLPAMYYNILALCIERVYASINYRKYDRNHNARLATILIICIWTVAICLNGWHIFWMPTNQFVPFCDSQFTPPATPVQLVLPLYMSLEILSTLITILIFYYNKYLFKSIAINRAKYDLSSRFLIDQNCQVNSILLPTMAMHFLCHLPVFGIQFPVNFSMMNLETKMLIMRSTYLFRLTYALFDPMIGFAFNVHLRQHLLNGFFGKILKKVGIDCQKSNKVKPNLFNPSNAHFDHLNKLWAVKKN